MCELCVVVEIPVPVQLLIVEGREDVALRTKKRTRFKKFRYFVNSGISTRMNVWYNFVSYTGSPFDCLDYSRESESYLTYTCNRKYRF